MGRRIAWLLALAACSPDAANTAFRCDTDRGGSRGCPSGQSCLSGRCRRGGATGTVLCAGTACDATQQCCVDGMNAPRCIAAADTCPGAGALCDQRTDCASGDFCCSGETTACGSTCETTACLDATLDCPSDAPNCCFGKDHDLDLDLPWGRCSPDPCR